VAPVVGDDVRRAVLETASECLVYDRRVCDARFSKCCGGVTESFATAWDGSEIPYLAPVADGDAAVSLPVGEAWITTSPPAWCNTSDPDLLERILPGFDRETTDFYRWQVIESAGSLGALVEEKTGHRIGPVVALEPLARGASGRLSRLRIRGRSGSLIVGKELEIRRVLSRSHLYSSAFVAEVRGEDIVLRGAGWGHGVGLCQIGAGRQAAAGRHYREILGHYYPGASIEPSAV
jgi:SpoIID/LytB domain protein